MFYALQPPSLVGGQTPLVKQAFFCQSSLFCGFGSPVVCASGVKLKARDLLLMGAFCGFLVLIGQMILSASVKERQQLSDYQQSQNADTNQFRPIMVSSDCIEGIPARQVTHDAAPLVMAWLASVLLALKVGHRLGRPR
jgi:hypothetical protein